MSANPVTPNMNADLFIDGAWVRGNAGNRPNVDPGDGSTVGAVSMADFDQVQAAIAAASKAFPAWSTMLASSRGEILKTAARLLEHRLDEAAATILLETGKTQADARGEILRSIQTLAWNGEHAGRVQGTIFPGIAPGSTRRSTPTPLGVVAAITAWNFPAVLITRKLGAALAAGCTVVLKASDFCPATARLIMDVLIDAGLPAGVVNLVFGDSAAVSEQILAAPEVKALTFTGSTAVGKRLAELAAPNLIRPVMELGGHAPVIVWEDADIEHVIATTAPAKFGSAGQSCVAPSRYFVHESLYRDFVEALVKKAESYTLGHGNEEGTTMGAVAHQGRIDALAHLVQDARDKGATVEAGGETLDRPGFYFQPTVLSDVPAEADIMTEEPFGPLCAVVPFSDLDDAITQANAAPYSFAAYLFTDTISVRNTVVAKLNASNIGVNQTAPSLPDVPLGGLGNSGYGYEGGLEGILAFTQLRLVSETAHA
ncbi:aldehyde dehydrogenase family protein [Paenarthrobacter sp. NPDC090520]|uniref:aldehyde dehydrogenase family protein n=1 Tax=Paenarthrobacter sp. NPDC090520 TaxID=3364382 RepID=UPI00381ACD3C